MKNLLFILSIFCCILTVSALDIAVNRKACVQIVVNPKAGKLEKMAAADLKKFLEECTRAKFQIVPENAVKKSTPGNIYLGSTLFAEKNGFPQKDLKDEEWILKTIGKDLIITGAEPIGTFYGVWALLNKIGIYVLSPEQNAVPLKKNLKIGNLNERKKPAFAGRMLFTDVPIIQTKAGASEEVKEKLRMFALRSGINHSETLKVKPHYIGQYYAFPKAMGGLLGHTLCRFVDPQKYFKSHPEYFAMNDRGQRFSPPYPYIREGSLCMSNKEVWKITLNSLRKMIKEDRIGKTPNTWPIRYDISVLDNMPYVCKCPECTKISKLEGNETGLYLRYINFVANEIAKEYPDVLIKISAYSAVRNVPKITRPAPNVIVQIADRFTEADAFRPLTHPLNEHRLKFLHDWTKVSNHIAFSDYWNMGRKYFTPPRIEVLVDAIQPDLQLVHKLKAKTVFIEAEKDLLTPQPFYDLQIFIGNQMLMDPMQNVEKLINVFFKFYYGTKAAPLMRAYFEEIRQGVKTHPTRQTVLSASRWHFFNGEFALRNYQRMKKAAAFYPQGDPRRIRIEENMISLLWVSLLARREFSPVFQKAGIDMKDLLPECRILVDRYIRHWGGTKLDFIYERFNERFAALEENMPRPEKFKGVPEENIRIAGTSSANPYESMKAAIVRDPESITGKAMICYGPDERFHHLGKVKLRSGAHAPRLFGLSNSTGNKQKIKMMMKNLPSDEKYHWYKLPGSLDLATRAWFWGLCWGIQFNMSSFYVLSDGVSDNNVWECWFSAKFTGPAYNKNSKKPNAVYVDMVVLTKPGTKGITGGDWYNRSSDVSQTSKAPVKVQPPQEKKSVSSENKVVPVVKKSAPVSLKKTSSPGILAGPFVTHVSTDTATISFEYSENIAAAVRYWEVGQKKKYIAGDQPHYGMFPRKKLHRFELKDLQPGKRYQFEILNRQRIPGVISSGKFTTLPNDGIEHTMTAISDTQTSDAKREELVRSFVKKGLFKKTDLLVSLGDVTSTFTDFNKNYFESFLIPFRQEGVSAPFYPVRGNHEYRGPDTDKFVQYFGCPYYAFRYGKVLYIVLDTGEDKSRRAKDGHYTLLTDTRKHFEEQKQWLLQLIKSDMCKTAEKRIVLAHATPFEWESRYYSQNIASFASVFYGENPQCRIDLWLCGDIHSPYRFDPVTKELAGAQRVPTAWRPCRLTPGDLKNIHFPVYVNDGPRAAGGQFSVTQVKVQKDGLLLTCTNEKGVVMDQIFIRRGKAFEVKQGIYKKYTPYKK